MYIGSPPGDLAPEIHETAVICDGAVIRNGTESPTKIGMDVIIMHNAYVGHDVEIGARTSVNPCACIGGKAKIGKDCKIRMNCTIRPGVIITDGVTVGMGSVVTKDLLTPGVYYGVPAKKRFSLIRFFKSVRNGVCRV